MNMNTDAAAAVTAVADAAAVHSSRLSIAYLHDRFSLADVTRPLPLHACIRRAKQPA